MVAAHHLIWTAYGWWMPNDPRGSSSRELRVPQLAGLGELHRGRKVVQPSRRELLAFYDRAAGTLRHELLKFPPDEIAVVAGGLGEAVRRCGYTCYAAAVMPDHVHMVIRKHRDRAEAMIENCQSVTRDRLRDAGRRDEDHPVWGGPGWTVFLNTADDVRRTVRYVEQNPVKIGRPVQRHDWVTEYDGWLPGLSPHRRGHTRNRKR